MIYRIRTSLLGLVVSLALGATTTPLEAAQRARFLYVANGGLGPGVVSGFTVDAQYGTLRAIGTTATEGDGALAIAADPLGRFIFVSNWVSSTIAAFQIHPASGVLTPAPGSPFSLAGVGPESVTVDPAGQFVYVADSSSNQVEAYQIDSASGALARAGPAQSTGSGPRGVTVHPNGLFGYVANHDSNDVSTFSIDPASGALTPVGSSIQTGRGPWATAVDPSGQYAYVVNDLDFNVYSYAIDPTIGILSPVGMPVTAGSGPVSIAADPDPTAPYVYAFDNGSGFVWAFRIQTDGSLTTIGSYSAGGFGRSVIVDPTARFLWATADYTAQQIAPFSINADGSLTAGTPVPVPDGAGVLATSIGPPSNWSEASPLNQPRFDLAAATGGDGLIYAVGGVTNLCAGIDPSVVQAYDPVADTWTTLRPSVLGTLELAAVKGLDGRIYTFGGYYDCLHGEPSNDADAYDPGLGVWSTLTSMPTRRGLLAAATAPNGKVYVIGGAGAGIGSFSVVEAYDSSTDTWTTVQPLPAGRAGHAAVTGLDGRIYVMGGGDASGPTNSVVAYDPASDTWSEVAPMPTARRRLAAALGQDGRIYTFGGYHTFDFPSNTVEAYDPATNSWTTLEVMPTAREALAAATAPDGRIFTIGGIYGPDVLYTVEAFTPPQP